MLEQIWNMLEVRGLLGTKESGPVLTPKQVEDLSLGLSFAVIALVIGINNLSRQKRSEEAKSSDDESQLANK